MFRFLLLFFWARRFSHERKGGLAWGMHSLFLFSPLFIYPPFYWTFPRFEVCCWHQAPPFAGHASCETRPEREEEGGPKSSILNIGGPLEWP
jgi:hypothetical protein